MQDLPDLQTLFVYGDPSGSEERFMALAEDPVIQANFPYFCELLTRLARTRGLQRRFDDAQATLDQAAALKCDDAACRVRIPLERGRVFNSSGDKASARPLFEEAFQIAKEFQQDELAVDAAHMMGIVEAGQDSLDWNERAIALAENSDDPKAKKWFGSLYNNTAWTYHTGGNFERALELFEKAKGYRVTQGQPAEIRIAEWCIARCLRSMGRLTEALATQERLLAEGDGDDGYVWEELGELHLAMGEPEKSVPYFAKAHAKLSLDPWLQANEAARLERLRSLGTA
jgi:tetratricopeptide (TPR) repeat protein